MDILWIFIKTFRKNVLNPNFGSCTQDKMDKRDPDAYKKARLGGLGIGICPTHSEIDLLCKSVKYALRRVKQAPLVKYFLRKCECKMDFRFWRKSIFY